MRPVRENCRVATLRPKRRMCLLRVWNEGRKGSEQTVFAAAKLLKNRRPQTHNSHSPTLKRSCVWRTVVFNLLASLYYRPPNNREVFLFKLILIIPVLCFAQLNMFSEMLLCPFCQDSGYVSMVYPGMTTCTCMHCGNGYYDTLGFFHSPPDCNSCTQSNTCSKGHAFNICISGCGSAAENSESPVNSTQQAIPLYNQIIE